MKNRIFISQPCPSLEDWQALLCENLPTTRIEEMESHLSGCPVCVARLDSLTPSLPDDLWRVADEPFTTPPAWADGCLRRAEFGSPAEPENVGPLLFERKGKYKSHGKIAFGGMGEVYRAWEFDLERWVAIKIPSHTRRSANAIARFLEEAPRQAQLEHANIVRVYARDEQDGIPFFAMEFVAGKTLAEAGDKRPFQPRRAAELVQQIATAVHFAHKVGVFHLDLKPANIMLTADGIPKVVDFGLARTLEGQTTHAAARGAGTDEYMAPEQWVGELETLLERTDVYGLGAILYELLTGRPPFLRGAHRDDTRRRVLFDEPRPPRSFQKKVSRDLESICLRCLRKRPEDRYATAQDVATALQNFLDGFPQENRSWLTQGLYLVRRHRTLSGAVCAGLFLLTLVSGLYALTSWRHQRNEAMIAFETGAQWAKEGRIAEGFDRMRESINMLPWGESVLRGYFTRSVAAREASLNHEVARLPHTSQILAAVASPDGRYVLLGDISGATTLWDLAENTTYVLPTRRGRKPVSAVAFNRAGTLCSSGGYDCEVTVWDVQTRRVLWGHQFDYIVRCLSFLGNGDRLLTGTTEQKGTSLRMWEVLSGGGKEVRLGTEGVRPETTGDLVASPTGDRFVSVTSTNHRLLWDGRSGQVLADLSEGAEGDHSPDKAAHSQAAFSADGSRLAVAGTRLTLYNGRTGAVLRRVDAGRWESVSCVGFRDDGGVTLVVNAGRATAVRRLTPDADVCEDVPMDRPSDPSEVAAFTDAGLILTGHGTRTLRILKPPPFALPHTDLGSGIATARVVVSGDGCRIATLTRPRWSPPKGPRPTMEEILKSQRSRVQVWDSRALRPLSRTSELPGGHIAATIAYGPVADTFALGCITKADQAPVLLGTLGADGIITYDHLGDHASSVGAMAFTPDGQRLITGSSPLPGGTPAELICWAVGVKPALLWRVQVPAAVTAIAVSSDRTNVVVGDLNGSLTLRPLNRPLEVLSTVNFGHRIVAADFAHHASLVAVTHSANQVSVLEASDTSLALRSQFDQPGAASSGVAFSANDDTLYVASDEGVQRWDVHVMKCLDPVITFVEGVMDFTLNSRPEAMIAVTKKGQLILRTIPDSGPVHRAVVGPRSMPVDTK